MDLNISNEKWIVSRSLSNIWCKIFKNGPSKSCGRQSLKNLKWYYGLPANLLNVLCKFNLSPVSGEEGDLWSQSMLEIASKFYFWHQANLSELTSIPLEIIKI